MTYGRQLRRSSVKGSSIVVRGGALKNELPKSTQQHIDKIENAAGTQPLAKDPFFQSPKVTNVGPRQPALATFSKAPINSTTLKHSGGALGNEFFNIDFNKAKSKNKKKVFLDLK